MISRLKPKIINLFIIKAFILNFVLCVSTVAALFFIVELFDRGRVFIKEDTSVFLIAMYFIYRLPQIIHLMIPVATLLSALFTIGKLSSSSEVTAMRSCGMSVLDIVKPLLLCGACIGSLMFVAGETLVPFATERSEEIYNLDIKKKDEKGRFDKTNFWYREGKKFYNFGFYSSTKKELSQVYEYSISEDFKLDQYVKSDLVQWKKPEIRWVRLGVEISSVGEEVNKIEFKKLPFLISKDPEDFYNLNKKHETMNYFELSEYIKKLKSEGVKTDKYLVAKYSKISFPFVNIIVILVAVPFAVVSTRSGGLTKSLVFGIALGFGYYVVHAICSSLGGAQLLHPVLASWSANIFYFLLGGYLMCNAEFSNS